MVAAAGRTAGLTAPAAGAQVVWFEGSYSEYEVDKRKRSGGAEPSRLKYRPMAALGA